MTRAVKVGERAPGFSLRDARGRQVSLDEFKGRPIVLYFYPHDFTPVCTRESCEFRDRYARLQEAGAQVIGVSPDSPESHAKFTARYRLPYPLLTDADGTAAKAYGVKTILGMLRRRVTFVIDKDGVVRHRFKSQFRGRTHVKEALRALQDLQTNEV